MKKYINDFYFPFEGLKHKGTIIMLPYRSDTWKHGGEIAFKAFKEIILAIANHETVYVIKDEHVKYDISQIENKPNIIIININYNDCWSRDTSPIFLSDDNELIGVNFRFNAWGGEVDGLYSDYSLDDNFSSKILKYLNIKEKYLPDFILEGGSIHTNGSGVLLTTEACLLSKGRNYNLSKQEIENILKDNLNLKEILWLPNGIYNDETNEHVDNMACFYNEDTILLAFPEDKNDIQYEYSVKAYDTIINAGYKAIKIICPSPIYLTDEDSSLLDHNVYSKDRVANDRLAASYINFYQGADYIILPSFGIKEDEIALNQFKELYPDKIIYQINTKEILIGGGNIHCITMQIPEVKNEG